MRAKLLAITPERPALWMARGRARGRAASEIVFGYDDVTRWIFWMKAGSTSSQKVGRHFFGIVVLRYRPGMMASVSN